MQYTKIVALFGILCFASPVLAQLEINDPGPVVAPGEVSVETSSATQAASGAAELPASSILFALSFEGDLVGAAGESPRNQAGTFVPGVQGQGLRITNRGVEYPLDDNLDPHEGTIELWFQPDWGANRFQYGDGHVFVAAGDGKWPNRVEFLADGAPNYRVIWWDPAGSERDIGHFSRYWQTGVWYHLATTWSGSRFSLYINGQAVGSNTARSIPTGLSRSLWIGSKHQQERPANGILDEVRIYNRPLTATEIAARFEALKPANVGEVESLVPNYIPPPPGEDPRPRFEPSDEIVPLPEDTDPFGIPMRFQPGAGADSPLPEPLFRLDFEGTLAGAQGEQPRERAGRFVPGLRGQGLHLGERGLDYPLDDNLDPFQGTVALWFRPDWDGAPFPDCHMFLSAGDGRWPNRMEFCSDGAPNFRILFWNPEGREKDIGHSALDWQAGVWTHLAASWEGEEFRLYKDGELLGHRTNRPIPTGLSTSLRVGSTIRNIHPARGTFDEVRVYPVALTPEQIRAAMEGELPTSSLTPVALVDETEPDSEPGTERNLEPGPEPGPAVVAEVAPATPAEELLYLSFDNTWAGAENETPFTLNGAFVAGVAGQAIHLTDGGLEYPLAGNIDVQRGSVEYWFRPDWPGETSGVSYACFAAGEGMWENWLEHMRDGAVNYRIILWDLKGFETGIGHHVADWPVGEWQHLAATWDDSSYSLYLNGERIGSKDNRLLPDAPGTTIFVGYNGSPNLLCHGAIDELRVYGRALTDAEVRQHYTTTFPAPPGDLDGDGLITGIDLFRFSACWHDATDVLTTRLDLKRDGVIDGADVREFAGLQAGSKCTDENRW